LNNRGYDNVVSLSKDINRFPKLQLQQSVSYGFLDLRNSNEINEAFDKIRNPKVVINLAASVGGIGANQVRSAEFMMDTLKIGTNIVEECHKRGCKLVQIGTVCAYPKHTPVPFKEEDLWNGYPEETNAAYGIAKRTIVELVQQYNKQYAGKFNGINLIPVNLYGPGDNFDLESSHVIPAIIRKVYEAQLNGKDFVKLWGTGNATREFLYVKDAAKGIVDAMEKYEGSEPVNLGSGKEISIKELSSTIASLMGFDGEIIFDDSKPDGQPRRCLNVERAKAFGFVAETTLYQGLMETIQWYRSF
jgi:GDP-L-fucose synthase